MAASDFSGPGGVISADPGGVASSQGAATSAGPGGTAVVSVGTRASAGPAGVVASAGTIEALVVVAWLCLEVPVGSLEQGDQNPHNGSTCCWPGDTPLHDVLFEYK